MTDKRDAPTPSTTSSAHPSPFTPSSPSSASEHHHAGHVISSRKSEKYGDSTMENTLTSSSAVPTLAQSTVENSAAKVSPVQDPPGDGQTSTAAANSATALKVKCHHVEHKKRRNLGQAGVKQGRASDVLSSGSSSGSSLPMAASNDASSSSSDDDVCRKAKKVRYRKSNESKHAKRRRSKKYHAASDDGSLASDSDGKSKARRSRQSRSAKSHKGRRHHNRAQSPETSSESSSDVTEISADNSRTKPGKKVKKRSKRNVRPRADDSATASEDDDSESDSVNGLIQRLADTWARQSKRLQPKIWQKKGRNAGKLNADALQFKRVDHLWDSKFRDYKMKESTAADDTEFADNAFLVRRQFDFQNRYRDTVVDIKSKQLRATLQEVMKDCKSIDLDANEPSLDPNILFLYLEELRTHYKKTLRARALAEPNRKLARRLEHSRALLKLLVGYIDVDYEDTKKTLRSLLEAGNITFDLLWALFHPGDTIVSHCYGSWDHPRCFKFESAERIETVDKGEWYCVEGKYLEYDGKRFGYAHCAYDEAAFKGPRKITSLSAYPLKFHREAEHVRHMLIARGQRFVELQGMHYMFHKGLALVKKKSEVLKININGRIMIDSATFRRINPNYLISYIAPSDANDTLSGSDVDPDDAESASLGRSSGFTNGPSALQPIEPAPNEPTYKYKWAKGERRRSVLVKVAADDDEPKAEPQRDNSVSVKNSSRERLHFTDDDFLLASPVVLGFSFSEKLWLEFTLEGVKDIEHDEQAFDSLQLPDNQKSIVRALVESHTLNPARTIDDVVQGKGKGLVAVLHGPPGTGKTLTAEGISELLRRPLYSVSAGELGTDSVRLEQELQKILDIAHTWGAVLLLDEADVFLERREVHDLHRNALVSIFLRLLEYFQGILFLTTNRVETFDDAFQSRIHVALRYGELGTRAKKAIWRLFIDRVRDMDGLSVPPWPEHDLDALARHQLNGRQIKNVVRTAQALAINEAVPLALEHISRVLDVAEAFERDLKGGSGYDDAMRSYT